VYVGDAFQFLPYTICGPKYTSLGDSAGDIAICNAISTLHFDDIRGVFLCSVVSGHLLISSAIEWRSHLGYYVKLGFCHSMVLSFVHFGI